MLPHKACLKFKTVTGIELEYDFMTVGLSLTEKLKEVNIYYPSFQNQLHEKIEVLLFSEYICHKK